MKITLSLLFLCLLFFAQSQNISNQVVIGTIDTIHSKILNENRKIWVYSPKTDPNSGNGKLTYPVIYLLDGDGHFSSVTSMVRQFSEGFTSFFPQMIIVGILNTDRMRDLTPTHINRSPDYGDSTIFRTTGGGEKFMLFMEKELMPHIDSAYSTSPYRMFIGHSLGGLMVLDALLHHRNLFNSYVAIDPSLWYDDRNLMKQASGYLSKGNFSNETLYLAIANTMKPGMDTGRIRKDTANNSSHIRSILDFTTTLKQDKKSGLRWTYKYYPDDDHGSVPFIAEYDAMRFIFKNYRLPSWDQLTDSSYNADSAVTGHFKNLSVEWGYMVPPPEPFVNSLGYTYLQKKQYEKCYPFFKMNIDNYPQSANAFSSMGDYYIARGDKQKAIECFDKSLSLKETIPARMKLDRLKAGK